MQPETAVKRGTEKRRIRSSQDFKLQDGDFEPSKPARDSSAIGLPSVSLNFGMFARRWHPCRPFAPGTTARPSGSSCMRLHRRSLVLKGETPTWSPKPPQLYS